jgi:hypothetical protein
VTCVKGLIVFNVVVVCGIAEEFVNSYGSVLRKMLRRENKVLLARLKIENVNGDIEKTVSLILSFIWNCFLYGT